MEAKEVYQAPIEGIVHPKMNILSLFIPRMLFFFEHKLRYFVPIHFHSICLSYYVNCVVAKYL